MGWSGIVNQVNIIYTPMKYIKRFDESIKIITSKTLIHRTMKEIAPPSLLYNDGIENRYKINPDGSVSVEGSIKILITDHSQLPIKFKHVSGVFAITSYSDLTTLVGSPETCGSFDATGTNIKNLVGGPKFVTGDYDVKYSENLTSLEGGPERVMGSFIIRSCRQLKSLQGGPKEVGEHYSCDFTGITDLVGLPEKLEVLRCNDMDSLTSLKGFPKLVGTVEMSSIDMYSIPKDPRPMTGCDFDYLLFSESNGIVELVDLFSSNMEDDYFNLEDDGLKELCTRFRHSLDYNYIRGTEENPQIDLFRLKEALAEFDIERPELKMQTHMRNYQFIDEEGRVVDFDGNPL